MQRHQMITGEGSGFFISADGYAVTNNHVVDHAKSVQVTTDDGTIYTAKVIGTDPKTDLALIKVDGKNDFPYVKFADQAPRIGDWVVAVGNPFGLGGTVTAGIVSARGRDIGAGPYDDYIQIDAPINKGNSGGPAFDVERQRDRRQHGDLSRRPAARSASASTFRPTPRSWSWPSSRTRATSPAAGSACRSSR